MKLTEDESSESVELSQEELNSINKYLSADELKTFLSDSGGYPEPPKRYNLLDFFKEVHNSEDNHHQISKTGFLKEEELGRAVTPVRTYFSVANYADSEDLSLVAGYLRGKGINIVNTSLSRKGFFLNLSVTQKKESRTMGAPVRRVKEGMFGRTETTEGVDEV